MKNAKFIYVFDSLCSWCYAFHPELCTVLDQFPDADLQLISGGMFIGPNRKRVLDLFPAAHISAMYQPLIDYGGANITDKYKKDLLVGKNPYIDSERPAAGLCVFREYKPNPRVQLDFIHDTQTQMYVYGVDPNSDEYYTAVLPTYDVPSDEFLEKLQQPKYQEEAQQDFAMARSYGVDSYPQLIYQTADDQYYLAAKGYTKAADLAARIRSINAEATQSSES